MQVRFMLYYKEQKNMVDKISLVGNNIFKNKLISRWIYPQ